MAILIISITEPKKFAAGDVWFDVGNKTTLRATLATSTLTQTVVLMWRQIKPGFLLGQAKQGDVFVDATSLVPSMWDGIRWVLAVHPSYTFPPQNPKAGYLWVDPITFDSYQFSGMYWQPVQPNAVGAAIGILTGAPTPPQVQAQGITVVSPGNGYAMSTLAPAPAVITTKPDELVISGPIGVLIAINTRTGDITFGPNYTPDATANAFWQHLALQSPVMLKEKLDKAIALADEFQREILQYELAGFKLPKPTKPIDPNDAWNAAMGIIK